MRNLFGSFEELLALDEDSLAVRTVGLDYPGAIEDLLPLLDLSFETCAKVSLVRCLGYRGERVDEAVARIFVLLGLKSRLESVRRIVVKIGLIEGRPPGDHVTSHPQLLRSLLVHLRAAAPVDATISVAEGVGHDRDTDYVLGRTGIADILAELDIAFVDLNLDDVCRIVTPRPVAFRDYMLPRTIKDADFIVSLAKVKTHHRSAVTLGMKNLFGCVPGSIYGFPKTRLHYAGTARVIADLASIIMPDLTVLDSVVAMEGTGPLDGSPRFVGGIIAGDSVATTDAVAARVMGFAPILIPQFWYAMDKGLLCRPSIVADDLPVSRHRFAPPDNIRWIGGTADSRRDEQLALLSRLLASGRTPG